MARMPKDQRDTPRTENPETLAEMLFHLSDADKRRELEEYRIEFETVHGSTDLTRRYTSTWAEAEQDWLIEHDTMAYFDGLPPFVKAYLKGKMQMAAADGSLDDMPDCLLQLFVSGQMHLDHEIA